MIQRNTFAIALALALLCSAAALPGAEPSAAAAAPAASREPLNAAERDAFLASVSEKLKPMRALRVSFRQERRLALFLDTLRSEGVCFFQSPDKLRWELRRPYAALLICNAGRVAKFDIEDGKPRKRPAGGEDLLRQALEQIIGWMKGDFQQAAEIYVLKVFRAEDYRIELRPRSEQLREVIESMELSVDPERLIITRVKISEPQGDEIVIEFSGEEIDPELDEDLFDLRKPLAPPAYETGGP